MSAVPPLPFGWTEHLAPGGQPYYFNASTNESTYIRPLPSFPLAHPQPEPQSSNTKQKKEKPKVKTPIPGTPWLRVVTTAGNVFFTNTEKKESVWTVPEEIKEAVEELERREAALPAGEKEADGEVQKEVERVKREVKRKLDEGPVPLDEVDISQKRAKLEEGNEHEGDDEDDEEEEEEEEEWRREAAAQLAAEAEEQERIRLEEEEEAKKKEKEEQGELQRKAKALNMPERVDLSIDEAKALFKTLLREKDINPMLPWDTVLPLFITDPRYVLLPSVNARRDAFDEYCRDRVREIRAAKVAAEVTASGTTSSGSTQPSPKEEFEKLLREEVKSTRTSWTEWRRTWKNNRRFYGWGRDDREREKRFREWLKELGEEKRRAAEKAEKDFFSLLKEKARVKSDSAWKDVKRGLDKDPRYDAVGSSSLREELFKTYVKTLNSSTSSMSPPIDVIGSDSGPSNQDDKKKRDKERKERAVRERETHVRRERDRLEREVDRSKNAMSREEGELEFMTMLTDAIRESTVTWDSALSTLQNDPRFTQSPLPVGLQRKLFHQHVEALREKQLTALHALFEAHVPSLADKFDALPERSIRASVPATKLGMGLVDVGDDDAGERERRMAEDRDIKARALLENEFARWQRFRRQEAERAFGEMLSENAFVAFWGRVQKMASDKERREHEREDERGMHVDVDDEDLIGEEAGEDGEERVSLQKLAKGIHVEEIQRVLKNDKRYAMFDHMPEQRENWIKEHLNDLAAPQLSVHVHQ